MQEDFKNLIMELSEGNPGALNVLCALSQNYPEALLWLLYNLCKKQGITGSKFWVIFKDECGEDLGKTFNHLHTYVTSGAVAL